MAKRIKICIQMPIVRKHCNTANITYGQCEILRCHFGINTII